MGLNSTPSGERIHIAFFGRRNAGKSSLINAVTGQSLAVVSDVKGTTTDPVYKAMEILPLGPVMLIDTAGIDDVGALGELRVKKTRQVINKTDIAILVIDATEGITEYETELKATFESKEVPYIVVYNKSDLVPKSNPQAENEIYVSAEKGDNIHELKEKIAHLLPKTDELPLVGDLISPLDVVVLVTPIDASAPKGRLILPQQQTIRDILDAGAIAVVSKETELQQTLAKLADAPKLVITDSQAFKTVAQIVPEDILLTSFSILMARRKGFLSVAVSGVSKLETLRDGDTVLIAEGCTHHRQCEDIGTVKIPNGVRRYTGKDLRFETVSGSQFPEDLSKYAMIIHCGGCMLNEREVRYRMKCAQEQGIPFTNYGTVLAYLQGILERSVEVIPELKNNK